MLKYETNLSHIGPIALKYANPFIDPRDAAALSWRLYLLRPLEGIPTMVMHVFNSLDHNQLFSFVYDRNPWYRLPLNALNHAILAIAAMSLVSFFCERGRSNMEIARWKDLYLFLALAAVLTLGINSLSVPETRFGLPIFCVAGPLCAWGAFRWWSASQRVTAIAALAVGAYVIAALTLSAWVQTLA